MRCLSFVAFLAFALACGGSTSGGDASTDGASDGSNAGDGGKNLDGPYPCGSLTCQTGEYCVHPCCGGAPPACEPLPDSGTCPMGSHPMFCPNVGGMGCQLDPCKPPPPYCAAKDACIGPTTSGRDALCLCG